MVEYESVIFRRSPLGRTCPLQFATTSLQPSNDHLADYFMVTPLPFWFSVWEIPTVFAAAVVLCLPGALPKYGMRGHEDRK